MDNKKSILIIEDDFFIRDIYERQFTRGGFIVATASDGSEGLEKAATSDPNIILLDIMLPKMSGLEVLKKLRADNKTQTIPIILLTNLSEDQTIKDGFGLGAVGYLIKSAYTPEQVFVEVLKLSGQTV